ncbi:hypothetical protein HK100_010648 [Physocladia obscura]|uniref:BZIP domain-containing protein n=1 Tax=Physocladia obscura TaxID=109957 RepID=A0AAD5T2B2_9FUNG|nr:hypothetical protein HK100_010648 [Physocladia obscura]
MNATGEALDISERVGSASPQEEKQPPKKPGRKPAATPPASAQAARSRINQQAFRERKANYVKNLEEKVKELSQIVDRTAPTPAEIKLQEKLVVMEVEMKSLREKNAILSHIVHTQSRGFSHDNTTTTTALSTFNSPQNFLSDSLFTLPASTITANISENAISDFLAINQLSDSPHLNSNSYVTLFQNTLEPSSSSTDTSFSTPDVPWQNISQSSFTAFSHNNASGSNFNDSFELLGEDGNLFDDENSDPESNN